jgi:hypothetical protein
MKSESDTSAPLVSQTYNPKSTGEHRAENEGSVQNEYFLTNASIEMSTYARRTMHDLEVVERKT